MSLTSLPNQPAASSSHNAVGLFQSFLQLGKRPFTRLDDFTMLGHTISLTPLA